MKDHNRGSVHLIWPIRLICPGVQYLNTVQLVSTRCNIHGNICRYPTAGYEGSQQRLVLSIWQIYPGVGTLNTVQPVPVTYMLQGNIHEAWNLCMHFKQNAINIILITSIGVTYIATYAETRLQVMKDHNRG